ncbi:MAG: hypothetical protein EBQ99_04690 [Planctomycetes bacterium]|nr:hypothetical protein [Planctomycetota bacterium]
MRLHEPVRIDLASRLAIHFWANIRMLQRPGVLLLSSVVSIVPTVVFSLAVVAFLGRVDPRRAGSWPWELGLVAAIAIWLIGQHLFFVYAMQRWYAPFVRREFGRAGMPMCERCGHRLPLARPAACPECGDALSTPQEPGRVSG